MPFHGFIISGLPLFISSIIVVTVLSDELVQLNKVDII